MKTILTTSMALFLGLTLSQSALARGGGGGGGFHGGGGGGGGFHGGGGGHAVAAARAGGGGFHSMGGHGGAGGFHSEARPMSGFGGRSFATAPARTYSPTVRSAQTSGFQRNQFGGATARTNRVGRNNSIAFGGHNFAGTMNARVPGKVSRSWDHGHSHDWNHHHWGWRGNNWVILDGGYPYYGYGSYDYPYGYGYVDPGYGYGYQDAAPAPVGDNLAADVQQALNQNGYDAGPADGDVRPQTRNAIAAFQQDHGLTPTGGINSALLSALKID